MFRARRDRRGSSRFLALRGGLLFLAVGVWLAGLRTGQSWATVVAIVILLPAVLLGVVGRRDDSEEEE
jgi:hypothetical protein